MIPRFDPRPPHRRVVETVQIWTYILGLSTMLLVWALVAWATIGNTTMHHPDYALPNPTPAAQPYNTLSDYQRPRR